MSRITVDVARRIVTLDQDRSKIEQAIRLLEEEASEEKMHKTVFHDARNWEHTIFMGLGITAAELQALYKSSILKSLTLRRELVDAELKALTG